MEVVYPWRLPVAVIALLSESLFHMIYYIFCANRIYSSVHPQKGTAMYHSFKGLLSGAILTGLLLLASEPVEASGYEIVMPTEITNLHADVTHIMVTAICRVDITGAMVGLGHGVAVVDGDRSVIGDVTISMDSVPGNSIFSAAEIWIGLSPCVGPPIMNAPGIAIPYTTPQLLAINVPGIQVTINHVTHNPLAGPQTFPPGAGLCSEPNSVEPFSMIQGWNNYTFSFPVSDLSP